MNLPRLTWGAATARGGRRDNQDAYLAKAPIFLVADGMGGHREGRRASAQVVSAFRSLEGRSWLQVEQVRQAIGTASADLHQLADADQPPGSTLAGIALTQQEGLPCWLVFNIGDSRVYRLEGERVDQISVDHSRVQALVDAGTLTAEDAKLDHRRNIVTRALGAGMAGPPRIDQWLLLVESGDRLLLCTDGLTGMLTDQLIAATLVLLPDPQRAAEELVRAAVDAGGRDNVTVVVVDVDDAGPARVVSTAGLTAHESNDVEATRPMPRVTSGNPL